MANKEARLKKEAEKQELISSYQNTLRKTYMQKVPKKRPPSKLYQELALGCFNSKIVRPREAYAAKFYNYQRQKESLLKHLFVKYPVPKFMFNLFNGSIEQYKNHFGFEWFFCLAQGGSFQKMVKTIMTKKEVISFLKAPDYYSLEQAFWYAKMSHRGMPDKIIHDLLFNKNMFHIQPLEYEVYQEGYNDMMDFYAKYYNEMDQHAFDEISDFIRFRMANDQNFTLRGRTLNSVTALSNEWHALTQKASLGTKVTWDGVQNKIWYYENEDDNVLWEIRELKSNHDLINEGRKQKHCVGSYTSMCASGSCNIFTMRKYYANTLDEQVKHRITIEKRNMNLVQVRGLMNRRPDAEENKVVKRWATQFGYNYEPSKNRWF